MDDLGEKDPCNWPLERDASFYSFILSKTIMLANLWSML